MINWLLPYNVILRLYDSSHISGSMTTRVPSNRSAYQPKYYGFQFHWNESQEPNHETLCVVGSILNPSSTLLYKFNVTLQATVRFIVRTVQLAVIHFNTKRSLQSIELTNPVCLADLTRKN